MSGRFYPHDSSPALFKQGSIDLLKHEPHSPKSPSSSLAADDLRGHRGAGSSRRLRSFIGFALVLPSDAAKRLFTFPRCARFRIRNGSRIPLGAETSPLESAQPAGDRVPIHRRGSSALAAHDGGARRVLVVLAARGLCPLHGPAGAAPGAFSVGRGHGHTL